MNRIGIWKFILSRWSALAHDLAWVPAAIYLGFWLRFNLSAIPPAYLDGAHKFVIIALPIQGFLLWFFGLYRGFWRFASLPDLTRIIKSVTLGSLLITLTSSLLFRLEGIPRSVLLLYPLLLTIGLIGPRVLYRWLKDNRWQLQKSEGQRTIIVGAGRAGELLLRDIIHRADYLPVAIIDDNPKAHGREIHGVRVLGNLAEMGTIIRRLEVDIVLVAIPSATRETIQRIVNICTEIPVPCQTLPSLIELSGQQVEANRLRPVTLEDLLGRESVVLDTGAIANYLTGKKILITGGGGSIGSELCRQVAKLKPARLTIFENSEFNLYSIERQLRARQPGLLLDAVLGDVKNMARVDWVFRNFQPEVVFHAAAYKHVPMLETNPSEGVFNNVFGTKVVADAANHHGASRFVLVSTDKAVNPANVMGTTKRIAELYCQNLAGRSRTRYITTRFGNVLGSAGSVVPLFEEQIRQGGPVTVTHPEISRYFMTIPEAVGLILQAGSMGQGGEIFVLDMGQPVLIRSLAEQLIRLSGLKPEKDIAIVYTGLRPGEKLHEEIFHDRENLMKTAHPKLLLAESRRVEWAWLTTEFESLAEAAQSRDVTLLLQHLQNIVPEFNHNGQKEMFHNPVN